MHQDYPYADYPCKIINSLSPPLGIDVHVGNEFIGFWKQPVFPFMKQNFSCVLFKNTFLKILDPSKCLPLIA